MTIKDIKSSVYARVLPLALFTASVLFNPTAAKATEEIETDIAEQPKTEQVEVVEEKPVRNRTMDSGWVKRSDFNQKTCFDEICKPEPFPKHEAVKPYDNSNECVVIELMVIQENYVGTYSKNLAFGIGHEFLLDCKDEFTQKEISAHNHYVTVMYQIYEAQDRQYHFIKRAWDRHILDIEKLFEKHDMPPYCNESMSLELCSGILRRLNATNVLDQFTALRDVYELQAKEGVKHKGQVVSDIFVADGRRVSYDSVTRTDVFLGNQMLMLRSRDRDGRLSPYNSFTR
jgi:hypothetical protein